ncbi:PepSY domain-containing protein [Oceanobacillus sp. CAU 1775]
MKKKILATTGVLAISAVIGLSVYASNADSNESLFKEVQENNASEAVVEKTTSEVADNKNSEKLTNEEARQIALAEYPGFVTEFELDYDDGRLLYEMEIKGENVKHEFEMDVETGEIIKYEEERKSDGKYSAIMEADLITMEEAEAIALNEFSGMIKEIELDRDDNRWEYEIKVKDGNKDAEFEIDATTGEIIEFEIEHED